jgi:regulator of protease activity HflC (stomatin/prohibitin superfamily)
MLINRRGKNVALAGLLLQVALAALAAGIWWNTRLVAAWAGLWLLVGPLPLWLLTCILFYCRYLARREDDELRRLVADGKSETIFAAEADARPAAQRLRWMERFLTPAFTVLSAIYHGVVGAVLLRGAMQYATAAPEPGASAAFFFALGGAFVAFLFSRYATGMAKIESFTLLRAAGSYLFADAVVFLLLAAALAGSYFDTRLPGEILAYALPAVMLAIAAELALNFILDLYRPRMPGVERRPSYDSRLLSFIASPESIGHSIAEALNYQFGFEVSSTWFYKLLQRAFVPLILAAGLVLWLLSGVVVVEEGQAYVVTHLGVVAPAPLVARACPYFLWPWPIDTTRKFETGKVNEMVLGLGGPREDATINGKPVYLWTDEHGNRQELDVLVAIPPKERAKDRKVPAINVIKMVVAVFYRVEDPVKFGYTVTDGTALLEALAYRAMTEYAASSTLDEPLPAEATTRPGATTRTGAATAPGDDVRRSAGIMSFGRGKAAADLQQLIAAATEARLGVKIVNVAILGVHPPPGAAAQAFEEVVAAERERDKQRFEAQAQANIVLSAVAGDPRKALELAQAMREKEDFEEVLSARKEGKDVRTALEAAIARGKGNAELLRKEIQTEVVKETPRALLEMQEKHLDRLADALVDPAKLEGLCTQTAQEVENLFAGTPGKGGVQGMAAARVDQARADRWRTELTQRARAQTFDTEVLSYSQCPEFYRQNKYLDVLTDGIKGQKKYLLGLDRNKVEVWVNMEQPNQGLSELQLGGGK